MTKPIIAAVDPRREDVAPAALALQLARVLEAPLMLAAAYPVDLAIDNLYPEYARALGRVADAGLDRLAAQLEQLGVTLQTKAVPSSGSPARALHRLARDEDAQMLVIGSSERGPVGRVLPSAVTDRLLHGAPCPVAIAPVGFSLAASEHLQTIGVAFTDTPDGRSALAFAARLASAAHARIKILSVAEPPDPLAAVTVDALGLDYVRRAHEEAARTALERGVEALPPDLSAGGDQLSGEPALALASASEQFDLLVCGARGHGPVQTMLLGGTSHALVRMASCPVLVVPQRSLIDNRGATGALAERRTRR
jgi:nucleotide-binding universal stress UspA family protein